MSCALNVSLNYVSDILDEIALEGLDGITLEALWMRLGNRPNFCLSIDDNSKRFLWNIIVRLKEVRFYEIPEPRQSLKHDNYAQTSESILNEIRLELDEVYPYHAVKGVPGIFGSCKYYFKRNDVTVDVVEKTFQEVDYRWGNNLVIVASQEIRNTALMELYTSPDINFSNYSIVYDILEKVGRCRQVGLLTCGEGSIQSVVVDPKTIFHYLKILLSHGLIKKQSLLGSLSSNTHSSIIYLTRFYKEPGSESIPILQTAVDELKSRPPHYMMPCDEFYALFDENKKNRIKRYKKSAVFRKYIRIVPNLPYREVYPDAPQSEWERKSKGKEKLVRCFQLVDPNVELTCSGEKDSESDDEKPHSGFLPRGIYYKNVPIVKQAYYHIKNAGSKGMTHEELGQVMGLNKNFIRGLIKRLTTDKMCNFFIDNDGKRRSKRYIVGEQAQMQEAASEIAQILSESTGTAEGKDDNDQTVKVEDTEENLEASKVSKYQEENMSYRSLKRIAMIIKTIKSNRFRLFHQIKKYVCCEEKKEGLTITVDRVTISNLLKKLEADGLIKTITLTGKDPSDATIKVFTDPAFDPDEKLKENIYMSQATCRILSPESKSSENGVLFLEEEFADAVVENIKGMKKMLKGVKKLEKTESKNSKLTFLYSPKFTRLNLIHDFTFHLVYDYTGIVDQSQEELLSELKKSIAIDDDLEKEMPRLYMSQPSMYMFVPPLNNSGKLPGWFLISDLLTRMPLSLMVKTIRIYDERPELWDYLNHPIRKHFLVKDLPLSVRELFFNRKNQISKFYFDLRRLCYIGLVQFGTRFGRELYQSFLYLNRKASLLDTSTGPPAYFQVQPDMKFDVKFYEFETKADVKKYWQDMFNICMETNLGEKSHMVGKELLAERELSKESLKKYHEAKTVTKVLEDDNGSIPGDGLGAAGIDSVMYSFLRSNWMGSVQKNMEYPKAKQFLRKPVSKIQKDNRRTGKRAFEARRPVTGSKDVVSVLSGAKSAKKTKKIKERQIQFKRMRQAFYDETDLEALRAMSTLRVTWSPVEDNLLLVCKVAMMFLCPNSRSFVRIPWVELRRVLQEHIPESRNKTQRAIGRRVIYMMKNPTTVRSVNLCLEALKQMPESKHFDCTDLSERILPSAPDLGKLQEELYRKFRELVAFLKDRFVDNPLAKVGENDDLIPDTMEEFADKYELEQPAEDELNVRSIRENVIRATLLSSLCSRSDKTSSAVQLFEIYRQYHENELQSTVQKLNQDKVITVTKRSGGTAFKNGEIIPLNFAPFKLSFAFRHLLNSKYSHSIYSESYSQICKLLEWGDAENEVDLNECNIALFLLAIRNILTLNPILPEQIIILDKGDLPDTTYSKMLKKYCRMLEYSQSKVICTSGKIIRKAEDTLDIGNGNKRKLPDEKAIKAKKKKMMEPSMSPPDTGRSGSSRVILYMMREEAKKVAKHEMSGRLVREFCVVSASRVFCNLTKTDLEEYRKEMEPSVASAIVKRITSRAQFPINLVDEDALMTNYKGDDVTALRETLTYITSKGALGASVKDLRQHCPHEHLSIFLKTLTDEKVLIRSGINETRYISQKHSMPWLLSSFKIKRIEREKLKSSEAVAVSLTDDVTKKKMKGVMDFKSDDYNPPACSMDVNNKVKVVIRPWVRIDGSLNRKVLDRFLGTILGFVMSFPGCSLSVVMNRFAPSVTPVWTKELVEMLVDIGCVTFTTVTVVKKPTLFCKSQVEVSDKYTGLEDDNCVLVEAKMDALITLGLFIGNKTYLKDFLVD